MGVDRPWDDGLHHRSYFLPHLWDVEPNLSSHYTSDVHVVSNPLAPTQFSAKGNVITQVVPFDS